MRRTKRAIVFCLAITLMLAFISTSTATATEGKININSATAKELQQLKGIGKSIAERIVIYREKEGAFEKPEDIKKVKGIGKGTYEKIKDHITIEEEKMKPVSQ